MKALILEVTSASSRAPENWFEPGLLVIQTERDDCATATLSVPSAPTKNTKSVSQKINAISSEESIL